MLRTTIRAVTALGIATGTALLACGAHAQAPASEDGNAPVWVSSVEATAGGLTSEEVARRAVQVAPETERAEAEKRKAREAAARARTGFVPRLDLLASYTRLSDMEREQLSVGPGSTGDLFPLILDNYLLRASLTVPVSDYFLTVLPAYEGASQMATMAALRAEAERESVALRAKQAFYQYIRARAAASVTRQSVELLQRNVKDLDARVRSGSVPRSDLTQAKARLAEARVEHLRRMGRIDVAEIRLRRWLALPPEHPLVIGESIVGPAPPPPAPQQELLRAALAGRPEMRAMRALVRAREHAVDAEQGAHYPHLSVSGKVDHANPHPRAFPQQREFRTSWEATVALSWTPTDYFATSHRVDEARADLTQARADLAALEDGIAVEAAEARTAYHVARESVTAAREGVQSAQVSYHDRSARLRVGEATVTAVLEAESSLREAQLMLVDAYVALRVAKARLDHLVGRSVPPPP